MTSRSILSLLYIAVLPLALLQGCAGDTESSRSDQPSAEPSMSAKHGVVHIGSEEFVFNADRQCSIYPGGVVSIWGHLADGSGAEVVIDIGGPDGARIGSDGDLSAWSAAKDSMQTSIEGRKLTGRATFNRIVDGAKEQQQGSFEVEC